MRLIVENLRKEYSERLIFKNLNFEADSGQCLAVLGPNGSGKTTLLRVLSGLILPSSGNVQFLQENQIIKKEKLYQKIGFLGPYLELYQDLTAHENLQFFAKIRGLKNYQPQIDALMRSFGLNGREDDILKTYSSGMKQRLKYVFALLHNPDVLFVDEPRSNLDSSGIDVVYQTLEAYKKDHLLIMATNDPDDLHLADKRVEVDA